MNHQVEYESHSERNGNKHWRQRRHYDSDNVNYNTLKKLVNPPFHKLNQTQNNGLTSPSEEEDDLDVSDRGASPPIGKEVLRGHKSFQSEASTVVQHQPRAAITPNYSYKSVRYPYEYGYNGDTRERRIYMAKEGSNLFNLGAKLNGSIYRKPPPIGCHIESSFDQQSGDEDGPGREGASPVRNKARSPKVQKAFQTAQHSFRLRRNKIAAEPEVLSKRRSAEEEAG
jgi:hypothetical protein